MRFRHSSSHPFARSFRHSSEKCRNWLAEEVFPIANAVVVADEYRHWKRARDGWRIAKTQTGFVREAIRFCDCSPRDARGRSCPTKSGRRENAERRDRCCVPSARACVPCIGRRRRRAPKYRARRNEDAAVALWCSWQRRLPSERGPVRATFSPRSRSHARAVRASPSISSARNCHRKCRARWPRQSPSYRTPRQASLRGSPANCGSALARWLCLRCRSWSFRVSNFELRISDAVGMRCLFFLSKRWSSERSAGALFRVVPDCV